MIDEGYAAGDLRRYGLCGVEHVAWLLRDGRDGAEARGQRSRQSNKRQPPRCWGRLIILVCHHFWPPASG